MDLEIEVTNHEGFSSNLSIMIGSKKNLDVVRFIYYIYRLIVGGTSGMIRS